MVGPHVQSQGADWVDSHVKTDQATRFISPPVWSKPVGALDTNGGMPLEITWEFESEDEEDERHCREVVAPRGNEPTLSAEEVKRELEKDGLL